MSKEIEPLKKIEVVKESGSFTGYDLSSEILETLRLMHYAEPTQVQMKVLPLALKGCDIAVKSQTGTGKTAAFAIPLCEKADWNENAPQALILEPTRELAVQIQEELFQIGRKKRLKVPAVFGGFPIDKQMQTLRQKSHIVVGTPGRVWDLISRDSLDLTKIKYLVIDEADIMLDMGFLEDVEKIIGRVPADRQMMLFSATLGERMEELIGKYMPEAAKVILDGRTETVEAVEQQIYYVEPDKKYNTLINILIKENPGDCIIFCGTREMVNILFRKMKKDGIPCGMIHGEVDQAERLKTIDHFRIGQIHYLIATDVAARGVDFENITHVINYDFPNNKETFVHRTGRTGRNGKSGRALSFVSSEERRMKSVVEDFIGEILPVLKNPDRNAAEELVFWTRQKEKTVPKARKGDELNRSIMRLSIGGGRKSKMRAADIVGTVCGIEEISPEDIGIIDVRDSLTYVEILNGKGKDVLEALQSKTIKGKIRKVRKTGRP